MIDNSCYGDKKFVNRNKFVSRLKCELRVANYKVSGDNIHEGYGK